MLVRQIIAARAPLVAFAGLGMLWGTFAALVPDLKAALGVGDDGLGRLFLFASTSAVVFMLFAPRIGQALGTHAVPVSMLATAAAFALPGHMALPIAFGLAMALVGASAGTLDVLMNARVSMIEQRTGLHLMNLNHAGFSFGYAAGAVVTGAARTAGGDPGPVLGAMAVVVALAALAARERDAALPVLKRTAGLAVPLGPVVIPGGLVILGAFLAENATETWSALHIERTLGGTPAQGSLGPGLLGLTMGIGRLGGQIVAARVSEGLLLRAAAALTALGAAGAALAGSPQAAMAGFIVLGFGVSVIAPTAFAMIGRGVAPEARARAISRASALGYMGFFLGPPLLGALSGVLGLRAAFGAVALVALCLFALLPLLERRVAR